MLWFCYQVKSNSLNQSYLCGTSQGSGVTPTLKLPLCFILTTTLAWLLKHTTPRHTHTHTDPHTHSAEDRSISEHHLQPALAGSSVVNSLCKCSPSGSVRRAATVPHDQTCDVALKSSLHEWMNVSDTHTCRHARAHTHTETHMRDSRLCLSELPLPEPDSGASYTV